MAIGWALSFALAGRSVRAAEALIEALRAEVKALKDRPEVLEHRLERFSLLWFPRVSVRGDFIEEVKVGLPHCPDCVAPLKMQGPPEEWVCLDCQKRFPGTVADTLVMDSIAQQAVKELSQRRKGLRPKPTVSG